MQNVTLTAWTEIEAKIATGLASRWPWLLRDSQYHARLSVETPAMSASAELHWDHREGSAQVVVRVQSSECCTGDLLDIAEHARQICEVRDAMSYIHGVTSHLVVWPDGLCPCAYCSAKGESRGTKCGWCHGSGKL